MEPTNHPFRKENHLTFHVNLPGCMLDFQVLILGPVFHWPLCGRQGAADRCESCKLPRPQGAGPDRIRPVWGGFKRRT